MAGSSFFTPQGILDFLGFGIKPPLLTLANAPPAWQARLREAAYTSPGGTRIKFQYVDVSREFDLRGTAHDFPNVSDAYVQRKGFGSRRYPLTCYFSGPNCDLFATAFEAAILEPGIGVLEHPVYGKLNKVVPLGTVTRSDALSTGANQSVVQVTFWTTTGAVYPNSEPAAQNEIALQLGSFNVAAAQQFSTKMNLAKATDRASAIATIKSGIKQVSAALSAVSNATTSVRRALQDGIDLINFSIDTLIGQPLLLAQQITNLILAPGRAIAGIGSRLDGYERLIGSIGGSVAANPAERLGTGTSLLTTRTTLANDFHVSDLFLMSSVAGMVQAAGTKPVAGAPATYTTRAQAMAAAVAIGEQFDAVVQRRDTGFSALGGIEGTSEGQIDTGESYQALQSVVALTVGNLVQTSFGLKPEKRIVLNRDRTQIDLASELYSAVDNDTLDLLSDSNDFSGDQVLELKLGDEIVYYPS